MNIKILFILIIVVIFIIYNIKYNIFNNKIEHFSDNIWDNIYYVTIERLKERQIYMNNQFKKNNLIVKKHVGQDKLLINKNVDFLLKNNYIHPDILKNKNLNNGSLACLITHASLYKKLLTEPGNIFLIFEDDCKILPNFKNNVKKYYKYFPNDWDMIWLGHAKLKGKLINNHVLVPQNNPGIGFNSHHHCYLVNKKGIRKVLDILLPAKNFQPKDSVLRNNFKKFNAYFLKENLAVQDRKTFRISDRET